MPVMHFRLRLPLTVFWCICKGGGGRNPGESSRCSQGGVHDVSLELISWTLCPLGVGNRAGWQVPSAGWVIQEGPLPLICLFVTQPRAVHIFLSSIGDKSITSSCWAELFPKEVRDEISLAWPEAISWSVIDISGGGWCFGFGLGRNLVTWPVCDLVGGRV